MNKKRLIVFAILLSSLTVELAMAAPAITSISGKPAGGQSLEIKGVGFGVKSPAKPLLWADFDSGINPSSLGTKTTWDEIGDMEWSTEGINGTHGVKAKYVDTTKKMVRWTLRADYGAWNGNSQKFYVFKKHKMNFTIADNTNYKPWRMWPANGSGYPNVYAASHNGRVYTELTGTGYWTNPVGALRTNTSNWVTQEIVGKASSGMNQADGSVAFRTDGVDVASGGGLMFRSSSYPNDMLCNYVVHDVPANVDSWSPAWNANNNRVWVDDIYADTTWARVMLGDQPTFALCRKLEIQIPSAWSDSSVTVSFNDGAFSSGSTAYLYVFDKDGQVNAVGFRVTLGQEDIPPRASDTPIIDSVSGTALTGQSVQLSGIGFGVKSPAKPLVWADFESGINPSSLGTKTTWDEIGDMEWSTEGINGTHGVKAKYVDTTKKMVRWTLRADYNAWNADGQRFYLFKKHKMNFTVTDVTNNNYKVWRCWPANASGYPNIYAASHNGRVYAELTGTGYWTNPKEALRTNTPNWVTQEIIGKASSGINKADGSVEFRHDGVQVSNGGGITFRSTTYPSDMICNYVVHDMPANVDTWSPAWNANNNRVWADDVYADITWARVMLGDQPTFATCRKLEIQIPSAWSDSSVTVSFNDGAFNGGTVAYLYVFDKDGKVNASGFPVKIGSGGFRSQEFVGLNSQQREKNIFNPAKGESAVLYGLEKPARVEYTIHDIMGRTIKEHSEEHLAGDVTWDGHNGSGDEVASGMYLVDGSLDGNHQSIKKVVVIK